MVNLFVVIGLGLHSKDCKNEKKYIFQIIYKSLNHKHKQNRFELCKPTILKSYKRKTSKNKTVRGGMSSVLDWTV